MAAKTAAQATMGTYLMYKASGSSEFTKLVDIKNFPDLGGEPERVDVTTLSDRVRKYAMGVQDLASFTFGANYIAVYKAGGDVNAAQDMTITIFPSTEFVYSVPV